MAGAERLGEQQGLQHQHIADRDAEQHGADQKQALHREGEQRQRQRLRQQHADRERPDRQFEQEPTAAEPADHAGARQQRQCQRADAGAFARARQPKQVSDGADLRA